MSKFLTFSNDIVAALSGTDFLEALKKLSAGWEGLNIVDATSLEAILANGTARLREDAVRQAAEGAGLGQEYVAVIAAVGRIEQLIGSDAGKSLLRLLSQVDRFSDNSIGSGASNPGLVRLPPISVAAGGGTPALSFNIGAKAAIECEAGDLWPFRSDLDSDAGLAGLVRLQVEGEAEAGAAATLPLKFGSFGVAAEAKAEARLAWYLTPASPKQIFADAIVAAVPRLPLPTRFDALWNACQSSNLKGVVMAIDGKVALSAELALATTGIIPGVGGIGAGRHRQGQGPTRLGVPAFGPCHRQAGRAVCRGRSLSRSPALSRAKPRLAPNFR